MQIVKNTTILFEPINLRYYKQYVYYKEKGWGASLQPTPKIIREL